MPFKVGDRVVHPQYGVGHIVKLVEREFEPGRMHTYYEISIPGGSTLWVPLEPLTSGLRMLAVKSEIVRCRQILATHPLPLNETTRLRQSDMAARLKEGTIAKQCEVVRDLSAYIRKKPLSGTISSFLHAAQDVLCQEWAIVEEMPLSEAVFEVNSLLEKSRVAMSEAAVGGKSVY